MPRPWSLGGPGPFVDRMLAQIVGFRIAVERLEGKWKLNQNHAVERRRRVIRALRQRGDENARAVAALMEAMLPAGDGGCTSLKMGAEGQGPVGPG
jgi:transcriptional regulator